MRQKSGTRAPPKQLVKDKRRAAQKHHSAEENIRLLLEGPRCGYGIAALCGRVGIAESLHFRWSKEFLEAGRKRLVGDTVWPESSSGVKDLRLEMRNKKVWAVDLTLESRLLKKA